MNSQSGDSLLERVVGFTALPLLLVGCVGGALRWMKAGGTPVVASGVAIVSGYLVIAVLERWVPYERAWLHSRGDLGIDAAWFATNSVLNRLIEPPTLAAAVVLAGSLAESSNVRLWPSGAPILSQLALALVVAEWFEYWTHRFMHEVPLLWRFHALHHSAPRLYWLNAVRFHPFDTLLLGVGKLLPLAVIGAPVSILALVNVVSAVHGSLKHANVPARIGPLNWVFSMAELHRWHHSPAPAEANHNYGGNLIVWDVVFGTRYLPRDRRPPVNVGITDPREYPRQYFAQLLAPFRWSRVQRAGVRRS